MTAPAPTTHPACTHTSPLDGKVAWVSGGSRGLGRSIACGLAAAGAAVAVTARSSDDLDLVVQQIEADGGSAIAVPGSVTDPAHARRTVERIVATYGGLDVLVNNAGINPAIRRTELLTDEEWQQVLDVNLNGAFYCIRAAAPVLLERGGSIVNISSVHGAVGMGRMTAYAASKGGMELMTRALAVEWADRNVRVNCVAPGYLETDMTSGLRDHERWNARIVTATPLGRFGRPDEVVPAVVYLASDASTYVTGATLRVDGGWTAQ